MISDVKPGNGGSSSATLDWQVSVAGGAAALETDLQSASFAKKLGQKLGLPAGGGIADGGVTLKVAGDLSSSMEGNALAAKVRHSVAQKLLPVVGSCGSSALMAALFTAFATSIMWLVWIKEHGGTADGAIDGGGSSSRGGYAGVPGRAMSAQDELECKDGGGSGGGSCAAGRYQEQAKDGSVEFGL